jgi:hypothetical protein
MELTKTQEKDNIVWRDRLREGEISLKTKGGHGSENSFLQNYIRIFQDSIS